MIKSNRKRIKIPYKLIMIGEEKRKLMNDNIETNSFDLGENNYHFHACNKCNKEII